MASKDLRNYTKLNMYLNRATDVLRNKFKEEWNRKHNEEWNDRSCQQLINIFGHNYEKNLGEIERNNVESRNIDEWDISLLKQLLFKKQLFSLSTNDTLNIKELGNIRNKTAHYGSQNMSDCEFETYRKQLCDAIIALGDNEDELKKLECDDSIGGIEFSSDDVINDENVAEAKTLKELGNKEFLCENYNKAIKHYTSAILLAGLPSSDRAMIYSDRCICYFKLNDLKNASKDAKDTVKLWPQWWKGYYRLAQIYNDKDDYESLRKAEKRLIQAQSYAQNNEITELLNKVRHKIGPLERHEALDYRNHITATHDVVNEYYNNTALNLEFGTLEALERIKHNIKFPLYENIEECLKGDKYRNGTDGIPVDYKRAVQCYTKAANRGSAAAMFYLALMFGDGYGVKQDFNSSLQYLLKAAEQPLSMDLGCMQLRNTGVVEAKHALGLRYHIGLCVKKDLNEAIGWYEKAFECECCRSATNLGWIYMTGEDFIRKDLDKAEKYLNFAANKRDPYAMGNIARLYLEKDEPELALQWCERLHNKGYHYPKLDSIEMLAKQRLSEH